MRALILILMPFLTAHSVYPQDYPLREYDLERLAEQIFPIQDLDIDYEQLYENLAQILSNPIDLNAANAEQLRSLYVLNERQIADFLSYRSEQGELISVYELQSISSIDEPTLQLLIPFVTIRSRQPLDGSIFKRILNEQNNYLLIRTTRTIEQRRGYTEYNGMPPVYVGSPDKIYSRFRTARASDFSLGFTVEKDAGEKFKWAPDQKFVGFDYNSFHLQTINKGHVRNLTLGDYQAQFGQGVILGGGFGIGKGSETITTIRRSNTGFLPYTSINETGFFRGLASSVRLNKDWTFHVFFGRNYRDGTASGDSTGLTLSSITSSGLHRTTTELANRKSFIETNYGSVVSYQADNLEVGAIVHQTNFNKIISRNPTLYNQFYFQGSQNTNVGLYVNYNIKNVSFFGEVANTIKEGKALVAGVLASLTSSFDLALHVRSYDRNFQSLYGNALSENSSIQNESGYYLGWKYRIDKKHALAGYTDIFQFPWLRYRGYTPSSGHEWLARYSFQPNRTTLIYVQAREESKIRNYSEDSNLYGTENGIKRNYWINLDYSLGSNLSFKSRAQFSTYSFNSTLTKGFVLLQDINLKFRKFKLSSRYALFDTDDYDNRQYVYERDVWLAFSFPFYNGVGIRNYVMLQYSLNKNIDLWIRWSRLEYVDRESIGSGSELVDADHLNEIKFQARVRF